MTDGNGQRAGGIGPNRRIMGADRKPLCTFKYAKGFAVLIAAHVMFADRNQQFYVVDGIAGVVFSSHDVFCTGQKFIDIDRLTGWSGIGQEEKVELIDSLSMSKLT